MAPGSREPQGSRLPGSRKPQGTREPPGSHDPPGTSPASIARTLQSTVGNRAMQRLVANAGRPARAAGSRALVQRKFTVASLTIGTFDPQFKNFEFATGLSPAYKKKLAEKFGAPSVARLDAWARAAEELPGSPFATWGDAIAAAAKHDPPGPGPAPSPGGPPGGPGVSAPSVSSAVLLPPPSPVFGAGIAPPAPALLAADARSLVAQLPPGHAAVLTAGDRISCQAGLLMINGQVQGHVAFFGEMQPCDFATLVAWTREPETSTAVKPLTKSWSYRLRVELMLAQARARARELVGEARMRQPPFAQMTLADTIRLYDIVNSSDYEGVLKLPDLPRRAAQFALDPPPSAVHEFVGRLSFFMHAAQHLGLIEEQRSEPAGEKEEKEKEGTRAGGFSLNPAAPDTLRRLLGDLDPALRDAGVVRPCAIHLTALGSSPLGSANVPRLTKLIREKAESKELGFGSSTSAADHIVKHLKPADLAVARDNPRALVSIGVRYLEEARGLILSKCDVTSTLSQDGRVRSFAFAAGGAHVIVLLFADGTVRIATYIAPNRL
jgi:hypothetical protein